MTDGSPTIEVISFHGCPSAGDTLRLAREVAARLDPTAEVKDVRLTESQARERGLPGSPTVLVNGRDLEGRAPHATGAA